MRSNASWRETVKTAYHRLGRGSFDDDEDHGGEYPDGGAMGVVDGNRLEDATEIIASCAEDMHTLWEDEVVQELLRRRRIRLELAPGL